MHWESPARTSQPKHALLHRGAAYSIAHALQSNPGNASDSGYHLAGRQRHAAGLCCFMRLSVVTHFLQGLDRGLPSPGTLSLTSDQPPPESLCDHAGCMPSLARAAPCTNRARRRCSGGVHVCSATPVAQVAPGLHKAGHLMAGLRRAACRGAGEQHLTCWQQSQQPTPHTAPCRSPPNGGSLALWPARRRASSALARRRAAACRMSRLGIARDGVLTCRGGPIVASSRGCMTGAGRLHATEAARCEVKWGLPPSRVSCKSRSVDSLHPACLTAAWQRRARTTANERRDVNARGRHQAAPEQEAPLCGHCAAALLAQTQLDDDRAR